MVFVAADKKHIQHRKGLFGLARAQLSLCRSVDHAPATREEREEQATRGGNAKSSGQIATHLLIPCKNPLAQTGPDLHILSSHLGLSVSFSLFSRSSHSPLTTHQASAVSVPSPFSPEIFLLSPLVAPARCPPLRPRQEAPPRGCSVIRELASMT